MKAIILVAGEGKRLRPYTYENPKCLLPLRNGETPLTRLLNQLKKYGIKDVIVLASHKHEDVELATIGFDMNIKVLVKTRYKKNANRYSLYLAMSELMKSPDDVVIFEGDMVAEDEFINYVTGTDFEHKNVWFTSGKFEPGMHGGILRTDGKNKVLEVKVVPEYHMKYLRYLKITGVMRLAKESLKRYYNSLEAYMKKHSFYGYYLDTWANKPYKMEMGDASHYVYDTFNSVLEYEKVLNKVYDFTPLERKVKLAKVEDLKPIEAYNPGRMQDPPEFWTDPLKIEDHSCILDGHHRYCLAKKLNLKYIPVLGFDYDEVEMWSLREELKITKESVIRNATKGKIYPVKTVKHKFPPVKYSCNIPLENLK